MFKVWQFLNGLETFESISLGISLFVIIVAFGFLLDYLLQKQSFGVILNALYAVAGGCLGIYVRFTYLNHGAAFAGDPIVTILLVVGAAMTLVLLLAALRIRIG